MIKIYISEPVFIHYCCVQATTELDTLETDVKVLHNVYRN